MRDKDVRDKSVRDAEIKAAVAKFLSSVGLTAQRELEKAIRAAMTSGKLKGADTLGTGLTISCDKIGLSVTIHSKIEL